jgi:hypothetical protein
MQKPAGTSYKCHSISWNVDIWLCCQNYTAAIATKENTPSAQQNESDVDYFLIL